MSLYDARRGYIQSGIFRQAIPDREFLEKTLAAVKKRRGLIHGSMTEHGRVCALGAFAAKHDNTCVHKAISEALQEFNDSMPEATPKVRREKVIRWIEKRLAALS
jgi:hypothetical protein